MPITQSAKKALRQSVKRKKQNLVKKEAYKDVAKNIKRFAASGNAKEAEKLLVALFKAVDKAAKTNAIKKNKASRIKSRLSKLVAKIKK